MILLGSWDRLRWSVKKYGIGIRRSASLARETRSRNGSFFSRLLFGFGSPLSQKLDAERERRKQLHIKLRGVGAHVTADHNSSVDNVLRDFVQCFRWDRLNVHSGSFPFPCSKAPAERQWPGNGPRKAALREHVNEIGLIAAHAFPCTKCDLSRHCLDGCRRHPGERSGGVTPLADRREAGGRSRGVTPLLSAVGADLIYNAQVTLCLGI